MPDQEFSTMEQALATRGSLEPQRMAGVSVKPMGLLKMIVPENALAGFNPIFNGIRYRENVSTDRGQIEDILEHELTHADQRRREGLLGSILTSIRSMGTPYRERAHEKEAYDTSGRVHTKYRLNDVQLHPPRMSDDEYNRRRTAMEKAMAK